MTRCRSRDPEALVAGVARDPAGLRLAVEHHDPPGARPAQIGGRGRAPQARRRRSRTSARLARGGRVAHRGRSMSSAASRPVCSASSAATCAPQKKPWQRPISTRVRRRRPSRSVGGIGLVGRVADLAPGDALAEADDPPVLGVLGDPVGLGRRGAAPPRRCWACAGSGRPSGRSRSASPAPSSSSRRCSAIAIEPGEPGRADSPGPRVAAGRRRPRSGSRSARWPPGGPRTPP